MYTYRHNLYDKLIFQDFKQSPHAQGYEKMFLLSLELMSLHDLDSIKENNNVLNKKCIFLSMSEPQWYDDGASVSLQLNKFVDLLRQKQIFNADIFVPCFGNQYHNDLEILNQNYYGWNFLQYDVDLPFANNDVVKEIETTHNEDLFLEQIKYKFLHMNFTHRMHRQLFSKFLIRENLIDGNCVAINTEEDNVGDSHYDDHDRLFGEKACIPVDRRDDWSYNKNMLDLWAETPITDHKNPNIDQNYSRASYDFCRLSAVYIISETVFHHPHPNFSEKTVSALLSNRPFIVIGAHGSLRALKQKGYKTFDNFIDESYDSIACPNQRMEQIFKTVKQINKKTLSELTAHLKDCQGSITHNRKLMLNTIRKYTNHINKEEIKNAS